jgi:hypothetical protein
MSALPPIADIKLVSVQRSNSGSLAILAAIRRASSFVSSLAAERQAVEQKMRDEERL